MSQDRFAAFRAAAQLVVDAAEKQPVKIDRSEYEARQKEKKTIKRIAQWERDMFDFQQGANRG